MLWYQRHPAWLASESRQLSHSTHSYKEAFQWVGRSFVSHGEILVRLSELHRYPVLLVYPDATPFQIPTAYVLKELLSEEKTKEIASRPPTSAGLALDGLTQLLYARHQMADGSVCILETGDLHSEQTQLFTARQVIRRLREWLKGILTNRLPPDSPEAELYVHFPRQVDDIQYLISAPFLDPQLKSGKFYFGCSNYLPNTPTRIYFGLGIIGPTAAGVEISSLYERQALDLFAESIPDPVDMTRNSEEQQRKVAEKEMVVGSWWDIDVEPVPFQDIAGFACYLGGGSQGAGQNKLLSEIGGALGRSESEIHLGLRFPGRRQPLDWQFFRLRKKSGVEQAALIGKVSIEELQPRLDNYEIETVYAEYLTEEHFFLRNAGRAEREELRDGAVSVIGVGALGSEVADSLAKAGFGRIHLVDKETLRAGNVVRHTTGIGSISRPKTIAALINSVLHNPFVLASSSSADIRSQHVDIYLPGTMFGVSTIADDNVEGFLNEQAVQAGRTVFYARALRGGKAARIFRVIPGRDACKNCLSLYYGDRDPRFVRIPEDPHLPAITNECNSPVRPASAADLKCIASLTSRILIDYVQRDTSDTNHWIWSTESLPGFSSDPETPFVLAASSLPPHEECPVCGVVTPRDVVISRDALSEIISEARASGEVETGGILIGFLSSENVLVVTRPTGPGPNADRRKDWFLRDTEYCQAELEKATTELGQKGTYIGEWHYHPTGGADPSGRDLLSLSEIGLQKNYATDEPAMIIVGPQYEAQATTHPSSGPCSIANLRTVDSAELEKFTPS